MSQEARNNAEVKAMLSTLLTGTHNTPTLAIVLPVVNPMPFVRNQFRLFFLCSHTHRLAPCSKDGKGYTITVTKQWVKTAAPVLRVGLVLVKPALSEHGIPLPIPDLPALLGDVSGLHAKYLDAA